MIKHGDVHQRNEKGEIGSLIRQSLLLKRIFQVCDPNMTPKCPYDDLKLTLFTPNVHVSCVG